MIWKQLCRSWEKLTYNILINTFDYLEIASKRLSKEQLLERTGTQKKGRVPIETLVPEFRHPWSSLAASEFQLCASTKICTIVLYIKYFDKSKHFINLVN